MDEPRSVKFLGLLRVLLHHGVDFFVVGGVVAQLEGAPILPLDLDIVPAAMNGHSIPGQRLRPRRPERLGESC